MTRLTPADLPALELTYPEVGGTRREQLPTGYRGVDRTVTLGRGRAEFDRAAKAVLSWQVQRRSGLVVTPGADRAAPGVDVLQRLGAGPFRLVAPCRVVYVLDEPGVRGFAYGTLTGHPERGEEAFLVRMDDDGTVTFTVRAFSRPAGLLARLGGPVSRAVQTVITGRYLRSLQQPAR